MKNQNKIMDLTISAVTMATIAAVFALAAAFKLLTFSGPIVKQSMSRRKSPALHA